MGDENRSLVERLNSAHKLAVKQSSGEEGYAEREYVQNAIEDALIELAHYEKRVTHLRERLAERASEGLDDEIKIERAEIKIKKLEKGREVQKHLRGFILQSLHVSDSVMKVFEKCNLWIEKEVDPQLVVESKFWLIGYFISLSGKPILGDQKFTKTQESINE